MDVGEDDAVGKAVVVLVDVLVVGDVVVGEVESLGMWWLSDMWL